MYHPVSGQNEPAFVPPDEVPDAHGLGERLPQSRVRPRRTRRVEEHEVSVLLRVLDQSGPEPRIAEDRLPILREQVAREVDAAGPELAGDRGGGERGSELDPIEIRRVLPVPVVALEDDPVRLMERQPERPGAEDGAGAL